MPAKFCAKLDWLPGEDFNFLSVKLLSQVVLMNLDNLNTTVKLWNKTLAVKVNTLHVQYHKTQPLPE